MWSGRGGQSRILLTHVRQPVHSVNFDAWLEQGARSRNLDTCSGRLFTVGICTCVGQPVHRRNLDAWDTRNLNTVRTGYSQKE